MSGEEIETSLLKIDFILNCISDQEQFAKLGV